MRKLFRKGDAFRLVGERSRRTEAERETLDKAGADAAFRKGQRELYETVLRPEGFLRWRGAAFVRRSPEDWLEVIELQKERYGARTFTVNCIVAPIFLPGAEPDMSFAERLGILAVGRDVWWDFAPDAAAFQHEAEKRIRELHMYDVLRADRCISVNSLEARVPFGDLAFVRYAMAIDPAQKMNRHDMGKYLISYSRL